MVDDAAASKVVSRLSEREPDVTTYSPVKMFLISLVTIFTAEVGIMFAIHYWFPNIDPVTEAFVDGTLLVLLVFPILFFTIFRPMNEAITQLQAQSHSLETFREAIEHAGHSVVITDREGTIEYINPAVEEVTGFSKDEVIGQSPAVWKSEEHPERFYEQMWNVILSGQTFKAEVINKKKNGDNFVVHQTIAPIFDDAGDISRFVGIYQDVTTLKDRERQLREQRNNARRLKQRLSVLNRILRHDIRSGVTVIQGHAAILEDEFGSTGNISMIIDEINRLQRLSEQARSIEHTMAEATPIETIELTEILTERVDAKRSAHPDASLTTDIPPTLTARTSIKVERALEQVLSNAIEHNDSDEPEVHVTGSITADPKPAVEIEIVDNGPGIPEHELEVLGEDESQLAHMSGLGLWETYWIVNDSGGSLEFDSDLDTGTTVTIRLPTPEQTDDSGTSRTDAALEQPTGVDDI